MHLLFAVFPFFLKVFPLVSVFLRGLEDDESLLIVDLGGTTLDVSHVRSKMTGITKNLV